MTILLRWTDCGLFGWEAVGSAKNRRAMHYGRGERRGEEGGGSWSLAGTETHVMARLASRDMTAPTEEQMAKKLEKMESAEEKNQEKKQKINFWEREALDGLG